MLDAIRAFFTSQAESADRETRTPDVDPLQVAACALLLDVAWADGEFTSAEREHLEEALEHYFQLPPQSGHELIEIADRERRSAIDHFSFTSVLSAGYDSGQKMLLAEAMWGLVLADGHISDHEHYLTRKISNFLNLHPAQLAAAKAAAAQRHRDRASPG